MKIEILVSHRENLGNLKIENLEKEIDQIWVHHRESLEKVTKEEKILEDLKIRGGTLVGVMTEQVTEMEVEALRVEREAVLQVQGEVLEAHLAVGEILAHHQAEKALVEVLENLVAEKALASLEALCLRMKITVS